MLGLVNIPTTNNLEKCYEQLQFHTQKISAQELALWSQWGRFDPRLCELLVTEILARWKEISPVELNQELLKQPWPESFGVLISHGLLVNREVLFEKWGECAMAGILPSQGQQYFIGLEKMGGGRMLTISSRSTKPYLKWGYMGVDNLLSKSIKHSSPSLTILDKKRRLEILETLIKERTSIRVEDYLSMLDGQVSRRQAERDLAQHPRLKSEGFTRAQKYIVFR